LSHLVLLRQAGLPIGLFDQEKVLLTTDEFFALYNAIPEVSRDPAIGLKLGRMIESSFTIQSASPHFVADLSGMPSSGWAVINSSLAPRKLHLSSGGRNARCVSSGCWPRRKNRPCWWTLASHGS
jgi:hypothetical protein